MIKVFQLAALDGAPALEHFVKDLNGMIANDKACVTRWSTLTLSWWRRPLRLRGGGDSGQAGERRG